MNFFSHFLGRNRSGNGFAPFGGRNSVPSTEKMRFAPRAGMFERPKVKSANATAKSSFYRSEDHLFSKYLSCRLSILAQPTARRCVLRLRPVSLVGRFRGMPDVDSALLSGMRLKKQRFVRCRPQHAFVRKDMEKIETPAVSTASFERSESDESRLSIYSFGRNDPEISKG